MWRKPAGATHHARSIYLHTSSTRTRAPTKCATSVEDCADAGSGMLNREEEGVHARRGAPSVGAGQHVRGTAQALNPKPRRGRAHPEQTPGTCRGGPLRTRSPTHRRPLPPPPQEPELPGASFHPRVSQALPPRRAASAVCAGRSRPCEAGAEPRISERQAGGRAAPTAASLALRVGECHWDPSLAR